MLTADFDDTETTEKVYPPCEYPGCQSREAKPEMRGHRVCYPHAARFHVYLEGRLQYLVWPPPADEWTRFLESERKEAA